jgi:polyhydroxybutyrate depolymerase
MRRVVFLMGAALLLSACSASLQQALGLPADASLPGGTVDRQITSDGVVRHYLLHVPAIHNAGTPTPLIFNFHGYGSNSSQEENLTGMSAKADQAGFIVVYPDGLYKGWSDGPGPDGLRDLEFVRDLIGSLESQHNIDPQRIYATGISNGGGMTNRVG